MASGEFEGEEHYTCIRCLTRFTSDRCPECERRAQPPPMDPDLRETIERFFRGAVAHHHDCTISPHCDTCSCGLKSIKDGLGITDEEQLARSMIWRKLK